ncbi:hypothetical protein BJV77DRAFT_270175 [Russula vinacea]|nr:hypothetical protein BJV77DRAFT_270175 [Russula vinacea]
MKRFRLLDSGESTTTAERARRDLHYERRGRRRRQSHKRHCVQHRSPRSSSVGDVNNIEMDFGRPGGRPLMLIHAQPVCAVSLGHPEDPDLELGGSVHQIGRVRGPHRLATGAPRKFQSGAGTCLLLGRPRAPRVDSDLISYLPSKLPVPARRWRKVYTGHTGVSVTGFKDCCCYGFAISNRRKTHKYCIVPFKGPAPAGTYRTLLTSNSNNRSSSSSSRSGNSQSVNLNKTTAPTHSNKVGTHCPASIESAFYRVHTCPEPLYP